MAAGVIKKISPEERPYYTALDVQRVLGVSRDKSYTMIRAMRKECIEKGILHETYPSGKIPKKYFNKQCMIE